MSDYIVIEYSNSVDLGDIVYHNSFENRVYLDADVSKPEYELVEEGIENADGEFDPTFQKWSKKYSIRFYAQEFLVDALTLMAMHDQINVTLKNGESSNVTEIEVDYEWDAKIECWAEVTITFATEFIKLTNCDDGLLYGCEPSVVTADNVYDADGAGQDYWELVTPPSSGTISFFYTATTGHQYTGDPLGFYQLTDGAWVKIDVESGQFGEVSALTDCIYLVQSGNYLKIPYISSVTDATGGDATIKCYVDGVENVFYQVQYDNAGWTDLGDPALASAFQYPNGYTVSPGAGNWDFRIKWYTHSCDYGTGNEVNQTIT